MAITIGRQFELLDADFSTTGIAAPGYMQHGGTATDFDAQVPGFAFTPKASSRYYFEAVFLIRTSSISVGARPGLSMPTGLTGGEFVLYGNASFLGPNAYQWWTSAMVEQVRDVKIPSHTVTTNSYAIMARGWFETGASPVGDVQVVFGPETFGTQVTLKAGSFIAYYEGYTGQT